ncbi:adenylate/guanylate cyclase domain-containing protein [Speluncibacter jeojiensis]|uniref:adenylate/guanylate cyclase domain-containing protein n=1 Tax=Speluncibacter jeojiensis TaxID=2710754 RepID=UPI002FCC2059
MFALVVLLTPHAGPAGGSLLTTENIVILGAAVLVGVPGAFLGGALTLGPALAWFSAGVSPNDRQRRSALRIPLRQGAVHILIWTVAAVAFVVANRDAGGNVQVLIAVAAGLGAATTCCMGYLLSERILRPITQSALSGHPASVRRPRMMVRLVAVWTLCTGVPVGAIALIVVARELGWPITSGTPIDVPVLILAVVSLFAGLRGTVLISRSVSDPAHELVAAMGEVERGSIDAAVPVYDTSEVGRLQSGFNTMVRGLAERERLRDLFGRQVGREVARLALESDGLLDGRVQDVAVLFVDLVGSTTMAAAVPPDEMAALLNDFFRIVAETVEGNGGFINKFEGDAALAVFGAPQRVSDAEGSALAAARGLRRALTALDDIDFGIGVSSGQVFAGKIGGEHRYEYTVIGDPVNEAARLTELAKSRSARVLASSVTVASAESAEAAQWVVGGAAVLRGRAEATVLAEPLSAGAELG